MATLLPTEEDQTDEAFRKNSAKLFKVFMANGNEKYIVSVYKIKDVPDLTAKKLDSVNHRTSVVVQDMVPSLDETDGPNNETEFGKEEKKNAVEPGDKKGIHLGMDQGKQISIRIQALLSNPENGEESDGIPFCKEIHGVENSTGMIFTNKMDVKTARKGHFVRNWWTAEDGTNYNPKRQNSQEKY